MELTLVLCELITNACTCNQVILIHQGTSTCLKLLDENFINVCNVRKVLYIGVGNINSDHFRRDFILVVSSMYVLYAMKLLRKYSNDAMLCLTPNLTYALIHEVTVEKL